MKICLKSGDGMRHIDIALLSLPGGRTVNEDHAAYYEDNEWLISIVADGLGGCGKGDVASRTACSVILETFLEAPAVDKQTISEIFKKADHTVCSLQDASTKMKTTAAAVVMDQENICCVHTGDSRIYVFKNQQIIYQSSDHSVVMQLLKSGKIKEKELRTHPDRNKVLHALGSGENVCDIQYLKRDEADAILLCTDGFWQYVTELEMIVDLARADTAKDWIQRMCSRMATRVTPGYDNFTVIAIKLSQ